MIWHRSWPDKSIVHKQRFPQKDALDCAVGIVCRTGRLPHIFAATAAHVIRVVPPLNLCPSGIDFSNRLLCAEPAHIDLPDNNSATKSSLHKESIRLWGLITELFQR